MVEASIGFKDAVAVAAMLLGGLAYLPYFAGLFKGRTKPHAYTWLIWSITQGTATAGLLSGGGGLIAIGFFVGAVSCFVVFLLALRYGTRDITRGDTILLCVALAAILVWWQLDSPVLAVLMVAAIDGIGYLPTYRKLWKDPWSETLGAWALFTASYALALVGLTDYNLLTVPYVAAILGANSLLIALALHRRRAVPEPS